MTWLQCPNSWHTHNSDAKASNKVKIILRPPFKLKRLNHSNAKHDEVLTMIVLLKLVCLSKCFVPTVVLYSWSRIEPTKLMLALHLALASLMHRQRKCFLFDLIWQSARIWKRHLHDFKWTRNNCCRKFAFPKKKRKEKKNTARGKFKQSSLSIWLSV